MLTVAATDELAAHKHLWHGAAASDGLQRSLQLSALRACAYTQTYSGASSKIRHAYSKQAGTWPQQQLSGHTMLIPGMHLVIGARAGTIPAP